MFIHKFTLQNYDNECLIIRTLFIVQNTLTNKAETFWEILEYSYIVN